MKNKIKAIINNQLSFLRQEDKDKLESRIIDLLNPLLKEIEDLKIEKSTLEKKIELLQLELEGRFSKIEVDKLKQENLSLQNKIVFLNNELKSKFNKNESKTIAYQLGNSIIQLIKNPKQGVKDIPNTTKYLIRESINRRSKKNEASKTDRILNIVLNEDNRFKRNINSEYEARKNIANTIAIKTEKKEFSNSKSLSIKNSKDVNLRENELQLISMITDSLINPLSEKLNVLKLDKRNIKELVLEESKTLLIEGTFDLEENIWSYGLLSNNPNYPDTLLIIEIINKMNDLGLDTIFVDKSNISNYKEFELIRSLSKKVIFMSEKVKDTVDGSFERFVSNNYFDESNFYPDRSFKNNGKIILILNYFNTHMNTTNNLSLFFNKLNNKNITLAKPKYIKSNLIREPLNLNTTEYINNKELAEAIREHNISVHFPNENQDFIPQEMLYALASCIPIVTTRFDSVESEIGKFVTIINSPTEIDEVIDKLNVNSWGIKRKVHLGYRYVMNNYMTSNFINSVMSIHDSTTLTVNSKELVTIIMASKRDYFYSRLIKNLTRQNYENKELVIITQDWNASKVSKLEKDLNERGGFKNVKVLVDNSDTSLGERLNICSKHASYDSKYLAKMDDDDFYFENYLSDMMLPFGFGSYDMVGKGENFIYLEAINKTVHIRPNRSSYKTTDFVSGATLIIKKELFNDLGGFEKIGRGEDSDLIKRVIASGSSIYSADPFNFVVYRSKMVSNHTWQAEHDIFEKSCDFVCDGIDENKVKL